MDSKIGPAIYYRDDTMPVSGDCGLSVTQFPLLK